MHSFTVKCENLLHKWGTTCNNTMYYVENKYITVANGPSSILQLVHGFQFGNGGDHDTMPGFVCLSPDSSNCCPAVLGTNSDTGSSLDMSWKSTTNQCHQNTDVTQLHMSSAVCNVLQSKFHESKTLELASSELSNCFKTRLKEFLFASA